MVATDGKSALIWKASHFPFAESLLIPAIPLFGSKQIAATEVGIRRTTDHLVISAGIWTVWLPIDTSGRFPDVASIVPSARGATILGIDPHDAVELAAKIPDLPDRDGIGSVAVDTHDGVVVRAGSPSAGGAHEIRLPRSRTTHPPVRIAIDRRHLLRSLALGCLSLRLAPGKPMVAESADRTFVAVTIDSSTDVAPRNVVSNTLPRRMLPVQANGLKGHVLPPRPEATGNNPVILDPLAEAEGLRAALVDAVDKAAQLIQSLKQFRRQRRVLQSVRSSFQSLVQSKGGDV